MISFGTDGIRGKAGIHPLTPEAIEQIGQAIGVLIDSTDNEVIIGRDTRESGIWIQQALVKGLLKSGAHILLGDIMPTAAVSCAVEASSAKIGVMITASHNPHEDNGLKFFGQDGKKLSDKNQEALLAALSHPIERKGGYVSTHPNPLESWRNHFPKIDLTGFRILLDAAHGAAAYCGPKLLSEFGAEVISVGCEPNGSNINDNVGALHPPTDLQGCDIGICLDGDADRILLIDPEHGLIDGDDILWLLRENYEGPLVGTIMSNGGLEEALNGRLLRSPVGDRNVAALMEESNASLGAEPSGHVLIRNGMPSGDGLYTAMILLKSAGKPPFDMSGFKRWPISKINIRFEGKKPSLAMLNTPKEAIKDGQRVIVRYSGTESKLRILVEGNKSEIWVKRISTEFKELLK